MLKLVAAVVFALSCQPVVASEFDDWLKDVFTGGASVADTLPSGGYSVPSESYSVNSGVPAVVAVPAADFSATASVTGGEVLPVDPDDPENTYAAVDCNEHSCGETDFTVDGAGKPLCTATNGCTDPNEVPLSPEALADEDWYPGKTY